MRILVVEDEPKIADEVCGALRQAGYAVEHKADGQSALFTASTEAIDAIVLDLGLPRLDGLGVLKRLRAEGNNVPVIITSARGTYSERIEGIDAGADDYMPKPIGIEELLARLGAILRRSANQSTAVLSVGRVSVDTRRSVIMVSGRHVPVSALEFRLLRYMAHRPDQPVSQAEIMDHVYEDGAVPDSNAIEVLVARLRKKIGPDTIETRRGQGYALKG